MATLQSWQDFADDIDGQLAAWVTWKSERPVVLPSTPIAQTQQQIAAIAGATAAQTDPTLVYTIASGATTGQTLLDEPGVLLGIAALLGLGLWLALR